MAKIWGSFAERGLVFKNIRFFRRNVVVFCGNIGLFSECIWLICWKRARVEIQRQSVQVAPKNKRLVLQKYRALVHMGLFYRNIWLFCGKIRLIC